ncbi:MAG: hypothetical protein ACO3UU_17675 [Minisyncoccia bacterium]
MVRGEQYRLPLETEYRIFKRLGQEIIEKNENGLKTYLTYPDNLPVNNLLPSEAINIAFIKPNRGKFDRKSRKRS